MARRSTSTAACPTRSTRSFRFSITASCTAKACTKRCAPTMGSRSCSIVTCSACATPPACCAADSADRRRDAGALPRDDGGRRPRRRIRQRGLHPHPAHSWRRRTHRTIPSGCPAPSVVVIVKPQVDPPASVYEQGVTVALVDIVRNHPGSVNPLIKSNNLLNNALGDAGGVPARGLRRRDAQLPRRAGRMHAVESVHREERRRR